jgi:prepilin-type processing-associated H-X9-DG protein
MAIRFTCPHCGVQTDVAEGYAGQSGPCAGCGETITVPPLPGTPGYSPPAKRSPAPVAVVLVVVIALGACVLCGGGFLFFLGLRAGVAPLPRPVAAPPAPESVCVDKLRQIGLAMQSYHEVYGSFPPAYVADGEGRPMHSWRVLLLPYLGQQWLYDQYNFDEPWDSPNNLALANQMPDLYRCPNSFADDAADTSYVMIVGPGTISDGPTAHGLDDIQDPASQTIILVETSGSQIVWLEPRDLEAERVGFQANDGSPEGIRGNHSGQVHVLFADGSARALDFSVDPETIKAMTTIAGGEEVAEPLDR